MPGKSSQSTQDHLSSTVASLNRNIVTKANFVMKLEEALAVDNTVCGRQKQWDSNGRVRGRVITLDSSPNSSFSSKERCGSGSTFIPNLKGFGVSKRMSITENRPNSNRRKDKKREEGSDMHCENRDKDKDRKFLTLQRIDDILNYMNETPKDGCKDKDREREGNRKKEGGSGVDRNRYSSSSSPIAALTPSHTQGVTQGLRNEHVSGHRTDNDRGGDVDGERDMECMELYKSPQGQKGKHRGGGGKNIPPPVSGIGNLVQMVDEIVSQLS